MKCLECMPQNILMTIHRWSPELRSGPRSFVAAVIIGVNLKISDFSLDRMSGDMVHWNVWDKVQAEYLPRSQEVTRGECY